MAGESAAVAGAVFLGKRIGGKGISNRLIPPHFIPLPAIRLPHAGEHL